MTEKEMLTQRSDYLFIIAFIVIAKINCIFAIFTFVTHTCICTYKISFTVSTNVCFTTLLASTRYYF